MTKAIARVVWLALWASAAAELPLLHDDPWLGCFAVHEGKSYDFCMRAAKGEMWMIPRQRDKDPVAELNRIRIHYGIEELLPDGSTVFKEIDCRSMTSEQAATVELARQVVRGKVTGGAEFELVLEQARDVVSLGGRVLGVGKLTKHPLRFVLRVVIPNVYRSVERHEKDEKRAFAKRTRSDAMELKRLDGSVVRMDSRDDEVLDGANASGKGLERAELRLSYYEGRRLCFGNSQDAAMWVSSDGIARPWYEGMNLHWSPDVASDKAGQARLHLCVK